MILQICNIATRGTTYSDGFNRRWAERFPTPARQAQEVTDDDLDVKSYNRARRIDGWIPCRFGMAETSRHSHASISWGPSPSALAIYRGRLRNIRADHRLSHVGGAVSQDDTPASWASLEQLCNRFGDPYPKRPNAGTSIASYEPPTPRYPTGRAWLSYLSTIAGAMEVWAALNDRQRQICLAYFGGNRTSTEIAEELAVGHSTIVGTLDVIRRRFVAAGLPEPKPGHVNRVTQPTQSYSRIALNNQ